MADSYDPKDPNDPFYSPPDYPRWTEADIAPMPETPATGACPHCGTVLKSTGKYANPGDPAVCSYCLNLAILDEDGTWRHAYYDEAEMWDQDPRIKAMRAIWTNLPIEETENPETETPEPSAPEE